MGYKRARTVNVLNFEDPQYEGLVVRVRKLTVGEMLDLTRLADGKTDDQGKIIATAFATADLEEMIEVFSHGLIGWNLEAETDEEDVFVPVPTTVKGILTQDLELVMDVIEAWMAAAIGVPAPLDEDSNSGATSQELSLPMAAL